MTDKSGRAERVSVETWRVFIEDGDGKEGLQGELGTTETDVGLRGAL